MQEVQDVDAVVVYVKMDEGRTQIVGVVTIAVSNDSPNGVHFEGKFYPQSAVLIENVQVHGDLKFLPLQSLVAMQPLVI